MVPTWRVSNSRPRPSGLKVSTHPMRHYVPVNEVTTNAQLPCCVAVHNQITHLDSLRFRYSNVYFSSSVRDLGFISYTDPPSFITPSLRKGFLPPLLSLPLSIVYLARVSHESRICTINFFITWFDLIRKLNSDQVYGDYTPLEADTSYCIWHKKYPDFEYKKYRNIIVRRNKKNYTGRNFTCSKNIDP